MNSQTKETLTYLQLCKKILPWHFSYQQPHMKLFLFECWEKRCEVWDFGVIQVFLRESLTDLSLFDMLQHLFSQKPCVSLSAVNELYRRLDQTFLHRSSTSLWKQHWLMKDHFTTVDVSISWRFILHVVLFVFVHSFTAFSLEGVIIMIHPGIKIPYEAIKLNIMQRFSRSCCIM